MLYYTHALMSNAVAAPELYYGLDPTPTPSIALVLPNEALLVFKSCLAMFF